MQFHSEDPTTGQPPDPWDAVQSEFGFLRERLKETYRKIADENGPTEEEIKQAVVTLMDAWDQISTAVRTAMKDPETRDHLKLALVSFSSALGETISGLEDELRRSDPDWPGFSGDSSHETVEEGG